MRYAKLLLLVVLFLLLGPLKAETNLGMKIKQGENGRPVITDVTAQLGKYSTLAAYLQLKPGDEIHTAYSDPITLPDGSSHDTWDITSIAELRWVLARTTSRIGLTVKRDDKYIKSIAVYTVVQKMVITSQGPITVSEGEWRLLGPTEEKGAETIRP
jgi:hypothetical protein